MEKIQTIQEMEKIFDDMQVTIENLEKAHQDWKKMQPKFKQLMQYYGSENWFQDKQDQESWKYKNLKSWVLSEDSVYNQYWENRTLALDLAKTCLQYLE